MAGHVLQCVAECCSVLLQDVVACYKLHSAVYVYGRSCVAVCCSMLQCVVAGCCSVLQRCVCRLYVMCCSILQCVAVCCSVLRMVWRIAGCTALCMCRSGHVLQYVPVCSSVLLQDTHTHTLAKEGASTFFFVHAFALSKGPSKPLLRAI